MTDQNAAVAVAVEVAQLEEPAGRGKGSGRKIVMRGSVVLASHDDPFASLLDRIADCFSKRVSFQLISATDVPPDEKVLTGKVAYLENWNSTNFGAPPATVVGESLFGVTFEWSEGMGIPGAMIVKNFHCKEFFLKKLNLEGVPGKGRVHFDCNSWVYPAKYYMHKDRIFFSNETYLPCYTPEPLRQYREAELENLRGTGDGELNEWDRVYDYAFYNDLGNPDKDPNLARPVLGGSHAYPYPRRCRTGRKPTRTERATESKTPGKKLLKLGIYVPRDERFSHTKMADFLAYAFKSIAQVIDKKKGVILHLHQIGNLEQLFRNMSTEFKTMEEMMKIYNGGITGQDRSLGSKIGDRIPCEFLRELVRSDGERFPKFPLPQIIQSDRSAWRTDEEFAREMLAGLNPVVIRLLKEFPPKSELDFNKYGNQNSSISEEHILRNLHGLTVEEALKKNRLFILDHHDHLMPYVNRINQTSSKIYATRTVLFLRDDGTLAPLAIELSLPNPNGEEHGAVSKVYTPSQDGVKGFIWQLAKAYVAVNDSGYHQLISHWLNTHAAIEPFVIATNRHLSVLHPIHKLLVPHYRDTMFINAVARLILLNAGGVLENTVFPGKFSMEMSSVLYKNWVFTEQGLPADLKRRGLAVEDSDYPHNLRLLIEDYPYAVDGLKIWSAIEAWVNEYCSIYYLSDASVQADTELQAWWDEIREKGHGDKRDERWWLKMDSISALTSSCTTVIWVASALHAAVNFGQYSYAGYMPNRPTISRKFMPEPGSADYEELETNPDWDSIFLKTMTAKLQTLLGISLIEILSRHSTDEVYLGQRVSPEWTSDVTALEAFERFGKKLLDIEKQIKEMNGDKRWKNRVGPAKIPYTLLYPSISDDINQVIGLTGKGIPNSVSI